VRIFADSCADFAAACASSLSASLVLRFRSVREWDRRCIFKI
jgi:hypothetical protein